MLKRILVVGALVALTGCATHQQSNQTLGAIVGGAVGHSAIGGPAGTAIGAMVGAAIGGNQPTYHNYPPVIHAPVPVYRGPSCYVNHDRYSRLVTGCDRNFRINGDHYTYSACRQSAYKNSQVCQY